MSNIPPPKPPKLDLSSSSDDDDGDEGWQWWCSYGERWWQWWWCCWRCDDGGDDGDEGKGSGQDIQRLATDSPLGHLVRSSVFNETPVFKDKKKKNGQNYYYYYCKFYKHWKASMVCKFNLRLKLEGCEVFFMCFPFSKLFLEKNNTGKCVIGIY